MPSDGEAIAAQTQVMRRPAESTGPYTLRLLLEDVPLSADGSITDTHITCVEYWDGNLYIGTSAAEILHFVSLPPDSAYGSQDASFILASRLEPSSSPPTSTAQSHGVQQIVLLPSVGKACILCNGVLTFYSLPELSPAFGHIKVSNCTCIGGKDLNNERDGGGEAEVLMICVKNRIRLIKIGDKPNQIKTIEYSGGLASARRGRFACVADSHSYALLDVENQQKIPLFPISSLDKAAGLAAGGIIEDVSSPTGPQIGRSSSSAQPRTDFGRSDPSGHGRSTSLGTFVGVLGRRQQGSPSRSQERSGLHTPEDGTGRLSPQPAASPTRSGSMGGSPSRMMQSQEKALPSIPDEHIASQKLVTQPSTQGPAILVPHICSPVPTEFLLTTGTSADEPGVGIFVNCDGDVVRGTLEFSRYPGTVIVDGGDPSTFTLPDSSEDAGEGYVLATVKKSVNDRDEEGIEIQKWNVGANEGRAWLSLTHLISQDSENGSGPSPRYVGLATTATATNLSSPEIGEKLRSRRLKLSPSENTNSNLAPGSPENLSRIPSEGWEETRNQQEDEFAKRLGQRTSHIVSWVGSSVFWVVRSPVALEVDLVVDQVLHSSSENRLDQAKLIRVLKTIRNQEAKTETEYLSLGYVRQKISIILFADVAANQYDVSQYITEQTFLEGGLDPRVILSLVPLLRQDIVEGPRGIWIHSGLISLMERQIPPTSMSLEHDEVLSRPEEFDLLSLIKRYLSVWRQRKGFGSITDEKEVFATVDAALLHVLLYQDQQSLGPTGTSAVRVELYSIVDNGVDCFTRAIELLEDFRRLYVLSRLYQSRKMAGKVLATWRRIIEGEPDDGGEFTDGESEVRKYLVKIKHSGLVEEYGTWLAKRNPALGVQVFTDDNSRVKLPPNQVVQLLQLRAPDAVKVYLEHLVFGKKNVRYANDLISYYLDSVIAILKSNEEARAILSQSYVSYRALHPPKPTYRQFIIANAVPSTWWHDRLRLLELLGGSHGAGFSYDVPKVLERIEPFEEFLVPESIILDGRQGRHQQALRLLTHGLSDYHTAINYCLLGGSSIFHPISGGIDPESVPSREEQASLFKHLFTEFLRIEDSSDRIERTSELLERFGSWFDVAYVLNQIPEGWSVDTVSGFLISAFRRLIRDKNEAMITKALSGAQNLKISADFIEKCERLGPHVELAP